VSEFETAVEPADVNGYLANKGWRREGTSRGAFVWGLEPGCRLVVPERREYDDDDELLAEAIRRLAAFEERPEPDVVLDISEPRVDTQFYRMHPDTPSGTIPLPAGLTAVQAVHNLIRAAAIMTEQGPQLLIEGRRSAVVDRFLRRVSLGSARPGSYVLTSRVPVVGTAPADASGQLDLLPTTAEVLGAVSPHRWLAGRDVVSGLHHAVRVAHDTAGRVLRAQNQFSAFYDGVEHGLSANLCEALSDLGSFGRRRPGAYRAFEVGFGWAREVPSDESTEPIAFSENMVGVLVRASEELTRVARSRWARIVGQVETFHERAEEQRRIKVIGELRTEDGAVLGRRSLWVTVSPGQYEEAWEAQRNGWDVIVDGQVSTARGRLQMEPSRVEVVRR
jgi:hypothetical protein